MKNIYLKILVIGMLLGTLIGPPYVYYQILRWVVFGVSAYLAFDLYEKIKIYWIWGFVISAILFNPFTIFYFTRSTWLVIDMIVGGFYLISVFMLEDKKEINK